MSEPFFRLVTSRVVPLTGELVEEFAQMRASPTERKLDPKRVKHLKAKFLAGQAVAFHWATATLNGAKLRMNGFHSSNAVRELLAQSWSLDGLMAVIEDYEVPDEDSLAYLFRQFDDRKSGRTPADVSGAYQGLHEPLRDVPRDAAKLGVEGVAWWRHHVEKVPVPNGDDIYTLFGEDALHNFLRWHGDLPNGGSARELHKPAIVAAMYATFETSESGARDFWQSVAEGGPEFDDTAPAAVLDNWLKEVRENKDPRKRLGPGQLYQGCAYGWAAFRQEEPIKTIRYDTKKGWHAIAR